MRHLLAAALLPLFATAPLYAAESGVAVRLAEVKGTVSARASSTADWTPVREGTMLAPGGEVKTYSGSSVVLAFSDGNKVKLEAGTTFGIEGATTLKTTLRLFSGKLSAWVKKANKADFTVRHAAGVAAVRGTVFGMEGTELGLMIALFEGALDFVDGFGRPSSLSPGQSAQSNTQTGLSGISSLPPATPAPEEPKVEAPPPPVAAAAPAPAKEPAPETLPAAETTTETTAVPPPSTTQESATTTCVSTVSPSSPCP